MSIFDKRVTTHGVPPAGEPNIPARPFILFQEEDIDRIQRIFYEWLDEKIATVGHFRPGVG
jgi:phage gpG-like protein